MPHTPYPAPLIWETPSEDALGAVPLGNGELAASAWLTPDGTLRLLVGRTDAWDEIGRLCKLTQLELHLDPAPVEAIAEGFEHRLELHRARLAIRIGRADRPAHRLTVWIDAHRPALVLAHEAREPTSLTARLVPWRTEAREPGRAELSAGLGPLADPEAVPRIEADHAIDPDRLPANAVAVAHRNGSSVYASMLAHQGLTGFDPEGREDPLLHRAFGAVMIGDDALRPGREPHATALISAEAGRVHRLALVGWTEQPATIAQWAEGAGAKAADAAAVLRGDGLEAARGAHDAAWERFWSRSWIVATGDPAAEAVTRAAELQRYVTAIAGRGAYPIKFNGSLFNVPGYPDPWSGRDPDPDYRRWGGAYWFQNSRLVYWPTLASGDLELARPWIDMFARAHSLARYRVERGSHARGAYFPETITFWGAMRDADYGFDRPEGHPPALAGSDFLAHYFEGSLELAAFLIAHLRYSGDRAAWLERSWPIVRDVLRFYVSFYTRRDEAGHLVIEPAQALETWHEATNPSSAVAGLHRVVNELLALPAELRPEAEDLDLPALARAVPPLPLGDPDGAGPRVLPAERFAKHANMENPELYAVFPYAVAAKGTPLEAVGRTTIANRLNRHLGSWHQTPVQYAMLGMAGAARDTLLAIVAPDLAPDEARASLVSELDTSDFPDWKKRMFTGMRAPLRFPGFYGPNFDWFPDQCHGGVAWLTLQRMALQTHAGLDLLPAWPAEWDIDMRLHAPGPRVVELTTRGGRVEHRRIDPPPDAPDDLAGHEAAPLPVPTATIEDPAALAPLREQMPSR